MATKEDRRSALVHADFIPMISPKGSLKRVTMATNVASKLVMLNGTTLVLTEQAAKDGWLMLKDQVSKDAYEKIFDHLKAEQRNPYGVEPLDDKLLPKVCKERRKEFMRPARKPAMALREQLKAEILAELKAEAKA